jgi:hypothetical protein
VDIEIGRVTPVLQAVAHMGKILRASEGAFAHLTCIEADSVVAVLAQAGLDDEAVALVIGHAVGYDQGDEDGDAHELITRVHEAGHEDAAHLIATRYVAGLR